MRSASPPADGRAATPVPDAFPAYRPAASLDVPLFFYHVPKTAGTTVDAALHALAEHRGRRFRMIPREIGMRERLAPADLYADGQTLCYAGHCWFGTHRAIPGEVRVCTVLRDPVRRVVSEYLWRAANRGRPASLEDFRHHLDNLALPNLATRLLSGQSEIDWRSVDRAVANLGSCFLVGRTEDLAPFITAILTLYGGPTVRTARAKERHDPLRDVLLDQFAEEIARRNGYDRILYAYAEAQLFGRCTTLLRGLDQPSPARVRVDNPGGKRFVVTPE